MAGSPLQDFVNRLGTAPARLEAEMKRAVTEAGLVLGAAARRRLPASGRLRGVGRGGAPVGVQILPTVGVQRPTSLIKSVGPLHLLDNPTRAHTITAKPGSTLATPAGPRASVQHPGTAGMHTFETGIAEGLPAAETIIEAAFVRAGAFF